MTHSSASRAAVEGYTRALAEEWAERRIAVIAVVAGHFDTASLRKYPEPVWRTPGWFALCCTPLGAALSGSVVTLDGARDNWLGSWPPDSLTGDGGEVPIEARKPADP